MTDDVRTHCFAIDHSSDVGRVLLGYGYLHKRAEHEEKLRLAHAA